MQPLAPHQYESVRRFFPNNYPNLPMIYAMIEHIIPGNIWVDNIESPTVCLAFSNSAYCFLSGEIDDLVFQECVDLLKHKKMIKLIVVNTNSSSAVNSSQYGFSLVARRQYRYKNNLKRIPIYENNSGYDLRQILDQATIEACLWKELVFSVYDSYENYLKNGVGFILWDEKNKIIASEVHGIMSKRFVEIGTITHMDYRGKQLSTILTNHLIHFAVNKGLLPVWSCDETNIISWKIAEKQGMDELIKYTFHTREFK